MTKIEEGLYLYLSTEAGVYSRAATREYPNVIPQEARAPVIQIRKMGRDGYVAHSGALGIATKRYEVMCLADSYAEAKHLANAVRDALNGYTGDMETVQVHSARVVNEIDYYGDETERRYIALTVEVMGNEPMA